MPQFLFTTDADFEGQFVALLGAKREDSPDVDAVVALSLIHISEPTRLV